MDDLSQEFIHSSSSEQPATVYIKTKSSILTTADYEECEIDTYLINTEQDNRIEPLDDPLTYDRVPVAAGYDESSLKTEVLNPLEEDLSKSRILYVVQKSKKDDQDLVIEEQNISEQRKISVQSSKINTCYVCSSIFETMKELDFHIFTSHPDVNPFTCGICGESFSYKYHRDNHMQTHSEEDHFEMCYEPVICYQPLIQEETVLIEDEDNEVQPLPNIENPSQDLEHIQKDSQEQIIVGCKSKENYICDVCGVMLTTTGSLNIHMRIHASVVYTCVFCGEIFEEKEELDDHINIHTKVDSASKLEQLLKVRGENSQSMQENGQSNS